MAEDNIFKSKYTLDVNDWVKGQKRLEQSGKDISRVLLGINQTGQTLSSTMSKTSKNIDKSLKPLQKTLDSAFNLNNLKRFVRVLDSGINPIINTVNSLKNGLKSLSSVIGSSASGVKNISNKFSIDTSSAPITPYNRGYTKSSYYQSKIPGQNSTDKFINQMFGTRYGLETDKVIYASFNESMSDKLSSLKKKFSLDNLFGKNFNKAFDSAASLINKVKNAQNEYRNSINDVVRAEQSLIESEMKLNGIRTAMDKNQLDLLRTQRALAQSEIGETLRNQRSEQISAFKGAKSAGTESPEELKQRIANIKALTTALKQMPSTKQNSAALKEQIEYLKGQGQLLKNLAKEEQLFQRVTSAKLESSAATQSATNSLAAFGAEIVKDIKSFAPFMVAVQLLNSIRKQIIGTIDATKELSQAFADLRKVITDQEIRYGSLSEKVYDIGTAFGRTAAEVAGNISIFAQQGNNLERSLQLTTTALVAANAANFELSESTEFITAVSKIYKEESEDLIGVIDRIINVQAKHAATAKDLAGVFKAVSTSGDNVGVSMDKLIGYSTAIISVTRKTGNAVGTSLRTIFAKFTGEEAQAALKSIANIDGFKIDNGMIKMKSFSEVIEELAGKWQDLSSSQQQTIAKAFGGLRRFSDFLTLMNNYKEAVSATNDSINAQGTAIEAAEKQTASFGSRLQQMANMAQIAISELAQIALLPELFGVVSEGIIRTANIIKKVGSEFRNLRENTEWFTPTVYGMTAAITLFTARVKLAAVGMTLLTNPLLSISLILGGSLLYNVGKLDDSIESLTNKNNDYMNSVKKIEKIQSMTNKLFKEKYDILVKTESILNKNRNLIDTSKDAEIRFRDAILERAKALGITIDKNKTLIEQEKELNKIRKDNAMFNLKNSISTVSIPSIKKNVSSYINGSYIGTNTTESNLLSKIFYEAEKYKGFDTKLISEENRDLADKALLSLTNLLSDARKLEAAYNFLPEGQYRQEVKDTLMKKVYRIISPLEELAKAMQTANITAKQQGRIYSTVPQTYAEREVTDIINQLMTRLSDTSIQTVNGRRQSLISKETYNKFQADQSVIEGQLEDISKTVSKYEKQIKELRLKAYNDTMKLLQGRETTLMGALSSSEWKKSHPGVNSLDQLRDSIINEITSQVESGGFGSTLSIEDLGLNTELFEGVVTDITKIVDKEKQMPRLVSVINNLFGERLSILSASRLEEGKYVDLSKEAILKQKILGQINVANLKNSVKMAEELRMSEDEIYSRKLDSMNAEYDLEGKLGTDAIRNMKDRLAGMQEDVALKEEAKDLQQLIGIAERAHIKDVERRRRLAKQTLDDEHDATNREISRLNKMAIYTSMVDDSTNKLERATNYNKSIIDLTQTGIDKERLLLSLEEKRLAVNRDIAIWQVEQNNTLSTVAKNRQKFTINRDYSRSMSNVNFNRQNIGSEAFLSTRKSILDTQASTISSLLMDIPRQLEERRTQINELQNEILTKNAELATAISSNDVEAIATVQNELLVLSNQMDVLKDKTDIWRESLYKVGETIQTAIYDKYAKDLVNILPGFGQGASFTSNFVNRTQFDYSQLANSISDSLSNSINPMIEQGNAINAISGASTSNGIDELISSSKSGVDSTKQGLIGVQTYQKQTVNVLQTVASILGSMGGQQIGGGGQFAGLGSSIGSAIGIAGLGPLGHVVGGIVGGLFGGLFDKKSKSTWTPPPPVFNEIQKVEITNSAVNPIPIRDITEIRPEERISITTSLQVSFLDASQLSSSNIRKLAKAVAEENEKIVAKVGGSRLR